MVIKDHSQEEDMEGGPKVESTIETDHEVTSGIIARANPQTPSSLPMGRLWGRMESLASFPQCVMAMDNMVYGSGCDWLH